MSTSAGDLTGSGYETAPARAAGVWFGSPSICRSQFRELPLRCILVPTLGGPLLHFPDRHRALASVWAARIEDLRPRYFRAFSVEWRIDIAKRARQWHLKRVAIADGYHWPNFIGCWFLFEGEEDPYDH